MFRAKMLVMLAGNGPNGLLVEVVFGLRFQQTGLAAYFTHKVLLPCIDLQTTNHAHAEPDEKAEQQIHCMS